MAERTLATVVLAAGAGTRMSSPVAKPLHQLCGRAMVAHVLHAAAPLRSELTVVVVGHQGDLVTKAILEDGPEGASPVFVDQTVRRGTGDAVLVALAALPDDELDVENDGDVLVLPGDSPLLRTETLVELVTRHRQLGAAATLLTAQLDDPTGYGRVMRGRDGNVVAIVEQRDASPDQLAVDEVGTSVYCFRRSFLAPALRRITPANAQGEYYLTDVVGVLADAGHRVEAMIAADPIEVGGVNDPSQLAAAEAEVRRRINDDWLSSGVRMIDPASSYVEVGVTLASGATVAPGTILSGRTTVAAGATVGPHSELTDCAVGADAVVRQTVGVQAQIGAGAVVGPFATLRPGTVIGAGAVTGPFYAPDPDTDR